MRTFLSVVLQWSESMSSVRGFSGAHTVPSLHAIEVHFTAQFALKFTLFYAFPKRLIRSAPNVPYLTYKRVPSPGVARSLAVSLERRADAAMQLTYSTW
jgi:hypothetical protein